MLDALTWTCHVCGRLRPDELIGVARAWSNVHGFTKQVNVRYCRDGCGADAVIEAAERLRVFDR